MSDLAILFIHLVVTVSRLFGPGGARSVGAETLLVKHQLLILIEIDKKCSVARARQTFLECSRFREEIAFVLRNITTGTVFTEDTEAQYLTRSRPTLIKTLLA